MKKSVFAIALLSAMFTMPMTMKANNMVNTQPEYEMYGDHHHHHHGGHHDLGRYADDVVRQVQNTTFSSDKMNVAKRALRMRPMDAYGIRRVAECLTFSSDRKELLKYAVRYCVNLEDYYQAVQCLTFSSDKEEVMRCVDSYIDSLYGY